MFKKGFSPETIDVLVGQHSKFVGDISSEGTVKIEGNIKGDIKAGCDIYVSEAATIDGDLEAKNIYISGNVEGHILAKGVLHLKATSKLIGDIDVHSFVADEGSVFRGNCNMHDITDEPNKEDNDFATKTRKGFKKSSIIEDEDLK